ncbi:MAG: Flp family type IVb pilin [Nocardioides sp.]|nr:Flp family type IVb pilin [Nocardioides sp.]
MLQYMLILLDAHRARMDERGASAVEYGLLIAGIAALLAVTIGLFKDAIIGLFDDTCDGVAGGTNGCTP